jgi:hypothetical protein
MNWPHKTNPISNVEAMSQLTRRHLLRNVSRFALTYFLSRQVSISGSALAAQSTDLANVLPFDPIAFGNIGTDKKLVFAHWHVFSISFDNRPASGDYYATELMSPEGLGGQYRDVGGNIRERPFPRPPRSGSDWLIQDLREDIKLAGAIGIDAFFYNIVSVDMKSPRFQGLKSILDAAAFTPSTVKIAPNLDASILAGEPLEKIEDAIQLVAQHPGIMRLQDGRMILGAFMPESWPIDRWRALLARLRNSGTQVSFCPTYLNVGKVALAYVALADTISVWAGNYLDGLAGVRFSANYAWLARKNWCAPIWAQDFRPKIGVYGEARNSELFRESWRMAIGVNADFVQMLTWNDYTESSEIRPSTGIQYSFYDLAAYYIAWYKSGREPKIVRDVLYYFHRIESTDDQLSGLLQKSRFKLQWGGRSYNEIELLGFLTAPGQLEIEIDGHIYSSEAPAGMTSIRAPIAPGRPIFRLKRNNQTILSFESAFEIRERSDYQDLLYRGGSSTRLPAVLSAPPNDIKQ